MNYFLKLIETYYDKYSLNRIDEGEVDTTQAYWAPYGAKGLNPQFSKSLNDPNHRQELVGRLAGGETELTSQLQQLSTLASQGQGRANSPLVINTNSGNQVALYFKASKQVKVKGREEELQKQAEKDIYGEKGKENKDEKNKDVNPFPFQSQGFDYVKAEKDFQFQEIEMFMGGMAANPPSEKNLILNIIFERLKARTSEDKARVVNELMIPVSKSAKEYAAIKRIFSGGLSSGSLALRLSKQKFLVEDIDGKPSITEEEDPESIANSYQVLQDAISVVADALKNNDGEISKEDCENLKDTFIPINGRRMFIKDRSTGEGVVVNDTNKVLEDYLNSILKTAKISGTNKSKKCGIGEKQRIGLVPGLASQLRGEFMEFVHILTHEILDCARAGGSDGCAEKSSELFEKFKDRESDLMDALRVYDSSQEGEFSKPVSRDENHTKSLVFDSLYKQYGDRLGKQILMTIARSAARSYALRRPDVIDPIGLDTRHGKKGDTREGWRSKEKYLEAMDRQGVPPEKAESRFEVEQTKKGELIRIDNSLKSYVSLKDGIDGGSVSENSIDTLILEPELPKPGTLLADKMDKLMLEKELRQAQREGMADFFEAPWMADTSSEEYKGVASLQDKLNQTSSRIDNLADEVITTIGEKKIKVKELPKFVKTLIDELRKKSLFESYVKSGMISELESYLKKQKSSNKIRSILKAYLTSKIIENDLNSNNEKRAQSARDLISILTFASSGSTKKSCFLTADGILDGESITCYQNDTLNSVKNWRLNKNSKLKIQTDGRTLIIKDSKDKDNEQITISVFIAKSGRRSYVANVSYATLVREKFRITKIPSEAEPENIIKRSTNA